MSTQQAKFLFLFLFPGLFFSPSGVSAEKKCYSSMDAIIVLDASGSVGYQNWQKSVQFASNLGHSVMGFHAGNKVGVVEFSQVANEAIDLIDNKGVFDNGIKVLSETYQNGITRTELALSKAVDMFRRESVQKDQKLLVIVTDGKTTSLLGTPGIELIAQPTTDLKNLGVHLIAVGVSNSINLEELNLMATDPDSSNVLKMNDYDELLKHVDAISKIACPTQAPTTPVTQQSTVSTQQPVTNATTAKPPSTSPTPVTAPPIIPITTPSPTTAPTLPTTEPQTESTTPRPNATTANPPSTSLSPPTIPVTPQPQTTEPTKATTTPAPQEAKCEVPFHKIGCFHDDMKAPRPLPELLFTDRDGSSPVSSGITLDWNNWSAYLTDLVCRCSKAAKNKGYTFFSIQYYGECWSGPEAGETYKKNGVSSTCITKDGQPCTPEKYGVCAGEAETNYVYGIDMPREATCDIPYEKLGCYKDNHKPLRPMNELIFTDRETAVPGYSGTAIDWGNWNTYLVDLVCRCARKAAEKKYSYFGIQYFGQCWSGPEVGDTFGSDGLADTCVSFGYNACPPDPKANTDQCAGKQFTNYVYGIREAAPTCSVKYERVGCYNDNHSPPRPLPQLILTDRDPSDKVYSNVTIDWGNWDSYIDDLVCRCARVAQNKRFTYFGVQNYGECWSGSEAAETYNINGESANCMTDGYKACEPSSTECVGMKKTNFVYKVPFH